MYADKTAAGSTLTAGGLALTGMDTAQVIFWTIGAAVLILTGLTMSRWFRANPKAIDEGVDEGPQ